ncbi:MAG: PTS sugar transporter subunit IIA [Kiritimatiellae bacterium]|nr:PTS sugar transporter subunit IIA [Kiritimatiellia bacterium]
MKSQINILRQLQELVLTRDEHQQSGDGSHLDQINKSISELQKKLQPQVSGIYERLYAKNHIVTAAMSNGCCSVCGMQVPIAQSQQVKLAQHLVTCSSCGRVLFEGDVAEARRVQDKVSRDDAKTGISRFSAEELMVADLGAATREKAIRVLADAMEGHKFIENADSLVTAALEREKVLSTALGHGIAFPHVRGVEGGGLALAIGISKKGIDWDGEKVNIVVLSAIPVAVSAFYLRLMAGLSRSFAKKETLKALVSADSPKALWKVVVKATRREVK